MNFVEQIEKLEPEHYVLTVLTFVALMAPGIVAVAIFFPAAFMEMSTVKLILSALAVGIPATIPHIIGAGVAVWQLPHELEQKIKIAPFLASAFGLFFSIIISYPILLVSFVFDVNVKISICIFAFAHIASTYVWFKVYKTQNVSRKAAAA